MTADRSDTRDLVLPTVIVALAAFAALQAVAFWRAGGVFEYPLDDVYIHLAVAEQIAQGNYGINPGELASPASSILYPFLLVPFAGEPLQRLLPLMLNIVAVAAMAYFWARIVAVSGIKPVWAMATAVGAPLVLNFVGVAFTGMEHGLHVAASLMLVYGFIRYLETGSVSAAVWIGVPLVVLLRFEGLALALGVAGVICLRGQWATGLALAALAVVPLGAFAAFLQSIGLDPLPSSVLVKLTGQTGAYADRPFLEGLLAMIQRNSEKGGSVLLLISLFMLALLVLRTPRMRQAPWIWLVAVVFAAGVAHLIVGRFGWMNRYEIYVLAIVMAGIVFVAGRSNWPYAGLLAVPSAALASYLYVPDITGYYVESPRAVALQPVQMARLAQEHLKGPVAVNDIGRVAWGNPDYVLDLVGLASAETREIRNSDPPDGWAGPLAANRDVRLAMIFDTWLGPAIGEHWQRLGALHLQGSIGALGGNDVTFYATDAARADELREMIRAWAVDLPEGAHFEFAEGA